MNPTVYITGPHQDGERNQLGGVQPVKIRHWHWFWADFQLLIQSYGPVIMFNDPHVICANNPSLACFISAPKFSIAQKACHISTKFLCLDVITYAFSETSRADAKFLKFENHQLSSDEQKKRRKFRCREEASLSSPSQVSAQLKGGLKQFELIHTQ